MFLRIEKGSAAPISRQIAQQIASHCASGSIAPGDRLPSVRELARDLAVNQNTILRVYERLCRDGLLEMRQGQGTFVAEGAKANASPDEFRQLARQCVGLGLSSDETHDLLNQALAGLNGRPAASVVEKSS
jgi:GntR family transcriptional regulator